MLSLATLSKKERRQQFEAQVKAHDELLQQQAAAVAEQQHQQQQQVPDTTFYHSGSTAVGYQDLTTLGYTDSGLGLSYPVDPDRSQLYPDVGLVTQDLFYDDQSAYQCKC